MKHFIGATIVWVAAFAVVALLGNLGISEPLGRYLRVAIAVVGLVVGALVLCGVVPGPM